MFTDGTSSPESAPPPPDKPVITRAAFLMQVQNDWAAIIGAPAAFKDDPEIAMAVLRQKGDALRHLSDRLKDDFDTVLAAAGQNGSAIFCASDRLRDNEDIIMTAVRHYGGALVYASERLRNDRRIVMTALENYPRAYTYVSDRLKRDLTIVLTALEKGDWDIINYAPKELKDDRMIMRAAVRKNGMALVYASDRLKRDIDVVMAAVAQNGDALSHADAAMKDNAAVVLAAIKTAPHAYSYASDRLKNDPEIVKAVLECDGLMLRDLPQNHREGKRNALLAVKQNGMAFFHVPKILQNDPEIVLATVRKNAFILAKAPDEARDDPVIAAAALLHNWRSFKYLSARLREDQVFIDLMEQQKKKQSSSQKKSLNFLWLNLDLPAKPDPDDGSLRMPMPEEYIDNMRAAATRHPDADVHLWADSRRLTQKQWDYLQAVAGKDLPNLKIKDLCAVPAYRNEELFSRAETDKDWRKHYHHNIWLQVDAAKILVSLQGDYDQSFFADLDHAHVDIDDSAVQKRLDDHGLLIGGASGYNSVLENQLWGFDRSRKYFFEDYYAVGLRLSYGGRIAYEELSPKVMRELHGIESVAQDKICLPIDSIGLIHAEHPGHENSNYKGKSVVPAGELAALFNDKSRKTPSATPAEARKKRTAQKKRTKKEAAQHLPR